MIGTEATPTDAPTCPDCQEAMPVKVLTSAAGYYIGQRCNNCGPYCRLSGYYPTREAAEAALEKGWPSRG